MKNSYEIRGDVTAIFITYKSKQYETVIDTDDLEKVMSFPNTWRIRYLKETKTFYVQGNILREPGKGKYRTVQLHRWLFNEPPAHIEVDHFNSDGLDNRRVTNLRLANKSQNGQNRKGAASNSKSGVLGVCWHKAGRKWLAQVGLKGKRNYLGLYDDIAEAKQVVDSFRRSNLPYSKEAAK